MRIRSVRRFQIDVSKELEDLNIAETTCNKHYPQVSKKGTSHLFLWVCAHHMHCVGFHMIPGSEGCKDAHASLYEDAPIAPRCLMYDCACKLCEYSKAREGGFFRNTRFYHDEFHGFKHQCPKFLTASRLGPNPTTSGTNSSVAEQINGFLGRIKAVSKFMSQSHFVFYLQFFIHQWNAQNRAKHSRILNTAFQGEV